ncbi:peroxiredoxin [Bacillus pseudomycoides]|uniref:peroxiredoxin n=1 Tax=Bacillus pseudomycoides TaxID=64104 RepID=UPI001FB36FEF|nr:peroxiredoxin [Bacillus pseudomycoides]
MKKVEIGTRAPDFTAYASNGKQIKLSNFSGKNIVLYFYPKDMTSGCTKEACDFRNAHTSFEGYDTVILGVSADPISSHQVFVQNYSLPFLLLTDDKYEISEQYNAIRLVETGTGMEKRIKRSTFLIDKDGYVIRSWEDVKVDGHIEEILSDLNTLKSSIKI